MNISFLFFSCILLSPVQSWKKLRVLTYQIKRAIWLEYPKRKYEAAALINTGYRNATCRLASFMSESVYVLPVEYEYR